VDVRGRGGSCYVPGGGNDAVHVWADQSVDGYVEV